MLNERGPLLPLRLAAAVGDALRAGAGDHQRLREGDRSIRELAAPFTKSLAVADRGHVVLHVLGGPPARVGDVGELREHEPELGEEAEHRSRHRLDVVLAAHDDETRDLVPDEDAVVCRELVLDAVQALGHSEVQRARRSPADRCRHEDDVRPMDHRLVDRVELVVGIHLRDRTRPRAGAGRLRVEPFATAERELVEADEARFANRFASPGRGPP